MPSVEPDGETRWRQSIHNYFIRASVPGLGGEMARDPVARLWRGTEGVHLQPAPETLAARGVRPHVLHWGMLSTLGTYLGQRQAEGRNIGGTL